MKNYIRFGAMIATSTIVMYILMYLNTYSWDHIFFSETRLYMALMMGGAMSVIMLGFMFKMHKKMMINIFIFIGSFLVIVLTVFLFRSQSTVGDVSYMRAMIPHHSIAILTSERANIKDPRVKDLANRIIEAQHKEIEEMKILIEDLESKN
jgi:uncharacterized protein (DUF305 family)